MTLLELGVALVLLSLAHGVGNSTLSGGTSLLQLAGRCSYEIYLTHMFVVLGLMHAFRSLLDGRPLNNAAYLTIYGVMLAISVLLGYAVQRWFSEPLNIALRDNHNVFSRPTHAPARDLLG